MKELLSRKGITYRDHDVSTDPLAAQEVMGLTGQNGVPVTVIDGQKVVGFDQPRLEWLIAQAKANTTPRFGAAVTDVGKAGKEGIPVNFGAYVGGIRVGSIAEKAGLAVGDVIIQTNSRLISGAGDLERFFADINQGEKLSIVFIRGNTVNRAEVAT